MHLLFYWTVLFFLFTAGTAYLQGEELEEAVPMPPVLKLTLESAITRALGFNRSLMNTAENVVKAEFGIDLAAEDFEFQYYPNSRAGYTGGQHMKGGFAVGGGLDFIKKFTYGTQITISPTIFRGVEHYHTELTALITQPLIRGLNREYQLSGVRSAQFGVRSAIRGLHIAQVALITRTITSLYDIVKAQKALQLSEESYDRVVKLYQSAKLKEKIGLSDALDVYRAEGEVHHAEEALTSARERLKETEDTLRDILSLPLDQEIEVEVPLVFSANPMTTEQAVDLALKNRIEIDQAMDQWRESYRLRLVAKENLYPDLNLVLNYTNFADDQFFYRACTRNRQSTWGVGLSTTGDFTSNSNQIAYDQSLLAMNQSSRNLEQTKANLILEVKKQSRNLARIYERIVVQEEQIKNAKGGLYLSRIKFDRGMANNFDVIQAEKSLRTAEQSYWSAIIDHIVGEYQLLVAIGLLTDKPQIPCYD